MTRFFGLFGMRRKGNRRRNAKGTERSKNKKPFHSWKGFVASEEAKS
jgi:hypothetical protein